MGKAGSLLMRSVLVLDHPGPGTSLLVLTMPWVVLFVTCGRQLHAGLQTITRSKNPNWICLALTTCKPPDWLSFPFALFSPQIPKLVSKISRTESALKKELMSGARRTTFLWVLAKPNFGALKKQKTQKQSKCLTVY